jgi:hypothetical protein
MINLPTHLTGASKKYTNKYGKAKLLSKIANIQGGYMLTISKLESLRLPRKFAFKCRELSRDHAIEFALGKGVENITGTTKDKKYLRLKSIGWWKRQLKILYLRASETLAGVLGVLNEHITKATHSNQKNKQKNAYQKLNRTFVIKEGAEPKPLSVIAHQAVVARFSRYLNNVDGMTEYADALRHDCVMITITCPSRMHPASRSRYDGTSAREAQKHLSELWAKARRTIQKKGIFLYGIRVVEPHKDGTPHWHMMFFGESKHLDYAEKTIARFALAVDGNEKGALEARCNARYINRDIAKPASYLFKYLLKNLGLNEDGTKEEAMIEFSTNLPSSRAWAQVHGIRQIQMIGGASVRVWDMLRKRKDKINDCETLESMRVASHEGDYAMFFALQGGHKAGKNAHTVKTIISSERTNDYGEDVTRVLGVASENREIIIKPETVEVTSNGLEIQSAIKAATEAKKEMLRQEAYESSGFDDDFYQDMDIDYGGFSSEVEIDGLDGFDQFEDADISSGFYDMEVDVGIDIGAGYDYAG